MKVIGDRNNLHGSAQNQHVSGNNSWIPYYLDFVIPFLFLTRRESYYILCYVVILIKVLVIQFYVQIIF